MLLKTTKRIVIGAILTFGVLNAQDKRNDFYITNQQPLLAQPYTALPIGAIQPKGWLKQMLELQRDGLTGHMDEIYPVVDGNNNGWLGGTGDSWERGPYWLDGLTPLAYILNDEKLKAKVEKWVDWSVNNQREDGYFGPIPNKEGTPRIEGTQQDNSQDWWPKMVMLKVLQQYYMATKDERIITLMDKYFRYQLKELPKNPLNKYSYWAERRGGDNLQMVYWLYNITKQAYLLKLGALLHQQTYDWTAVFSGDVLRQVNPYPGLHCVNVAQGLKEPVIYYQQSKNSADLEAPYKGLQSLKAVHGFANGMYGGDEALHGNDPIQGSELCSAVEIMYSFESMIPITGNVYYADYLEKIAYNVLPTQHNDDFTRKQYFQQPNQIKITYDYRNFNDEHGGSNTVYGVLTGYPCCVSNMHQGWPKLVQNLFYATADDGIAAMVYAPASAKIMVNTGVEVKVDETTNYPFDDEIHFEMSPEKSVIFDFKMRVPLWCNNASVKINGELVHTEMLNNMVSISRKWKKGDIITLKLPMQVKTSRWFEKSLAIQRGPLLYALKIGEDWEEKKNQEYENSFYEVYPTTPWNYGIPIDIIEQSKFEFKKNKAVGNMPWNIENAPVSIITTAKQLPYWKAYEGSTGKIPTAPWPPRKTGTNREQITLIPYGCTTLRISEFPVLYKEQ
ncbi:beta-L-arabinofuranosidase domain-containing protein [Zhouia sp. PK063]|uniref:beta-L-arabinofuranosidase domain-containing protein n=1 Tax=Zhouia sp. PK063 TaxID=3373602 RepID=UPI0037AA2098